jgi:hypothetical protein
MAVEKYVMMAVGLLMVGLLFPLGLAAIETYVPTDPTTLIVWPLIGVGAVLAVFIGYIKEATS